MSGTSIEVIEVLMGRRLAQAASRALAQQDIRAQHVSEVLGDHLWSDLAPLFPGNLDAKHQRALWPELGLGSGFDWGILVRITAPHPGSNVTEAGLKQLVVNALAKLGVGESDHLSVSIVLVRPFRLQSPVN